MTDNDDLAALRDQTAQGDRLDEATAAEQHHDLTTAIVAELEAIDNGDQQKTVSVWDGQVAAFIRALEANPDRLEAVGHALQQELDINERDVDRSEVLRLGLRVGFKQAAPEEFDAIRGAVQTQATKEL